jgi:acyl-coenzyme A synthetase/AMP-(fatty) acid ligase
VVAALRALPGVADAEVVGVDDREWGRRVRAVVVADDPSAPPRLALLRSGVREVLPASHAPTELVVVPAIPRDAMGKVRAIERDRLAGLPATETMPAPDVV